MNHRLLLVLVSGLALVLGDNASLVAAKPARGRGTRLPVDPGEPWDIKKPPREFEEVCFQDRSSLRGIAEKEVRQWLEAVNNKPLQLKQIAVGHGRRVEFRGLGRLKVDWTPDTVLRLSLEGAPLKIYFCDGQGSIMLNLFAHWPCPQWAAYRTRRRPDQEPPKFEPGGPPIFGLLATEDHRTARTYDDTYEIRCQSGQLILSKGDIRILTVPFEGKPQAVFFEGGNNPVKFRDLALCRSDPIPAEPIPAHSVVLGNEPPAKLAWTSKLPADAKFERLADGAVELSASKSPAPVIVTVPIDKPGLYEAIFLVEGASFNSGVCLTDAEGKPLAGVEFVRDQRHGWTGFGPGRPGAGLWGTQLDPDQALAPAAGTRQWLRLTLAGGVCRVWTSGDGVHWSRVIEPVPQLGAMCQVGLFLQAGEQPRKIRLRSLQVRQLDGLMSLAPAALAEQAVKAGMAKRNETDIDLGAWQQRVAEALPPGADPIAWRDACALQTLSANANLALDRPLREEFVAGALTRIASIEARLAFLADATVLYDGWTAPDQAHAYAAHWERLGRKIAWEDPDHFDLFRQWAMTASIWTRDARVEPLSWRVASDRLLALLAQQQWQDLYQWRKQLRFAHHGGDNWQNWPQDQTVLQRLLEWTDTIAGGPTAAEGGWRRPVNVQLNREAYNSLAELQTATAEGLYNEAARVLAGAAIPQGEGLVPDARDAEQFTSYSSAVQLLMQRHPKLAAAMNAQLGAVEKLRVQQTIAQGNRGAIEALTLQFYGTPAASAAHRWLGDRLLSRGDFDLAIEQYRKAWSTAADLQQAQLAARVRLAGAMLGRSMGQPVRDAIIFGEVQVSAAEFERWVAEAIGRHQGDQRAARTALVSAVPAADFPAATVKTEPWARLEGDVGQAANQVPGAAQGADWPGRQLDAMVCGPLMLVANRFQVVALNTGDGKPKWTYAQGGGQGQTHAWSMVPMRPTVVGNRLYVRLLANNNRPQIVCLDMETGKRLWKYGREIDIVSDPLWVHDRLLTVVVDPQQAPLPAQVLLVELHPDSGEMLGQKPLFELQSEPTAAHAAQAVVAGEVIVASLAGATFACDWRGQLVWLRQSPAVPPSLEIHPGQQYSQPPLARGDRLYVTPSGGRTIECLDRETGRLLWRQGTPRLRRLLDVIDTRVIAETDSGLVAFSTDKGEILWRRDLSGVLGGYARSGRSLICTRRGPAGIDGACPMLVWIDGTTGRVQTQSPLWSLRTKQPQLGPLVADGKRLWGFAEVLDGGGNLQPQRSIVAISAAGPQQPFRPRDDLWTAAVDPSLRGAADLGLPGWTLLAAEHDDKTGIRAEWNGSRNILATRGSDKAARLARWIKPSAGAKLILEFGFNPASAPTLEVRADGRKLWEFTAKPETAADQWKAAEVDLTPCAGRLTLLTIVQTRPTGGPSYACWKRLEVQGGGENAD